MLPGSVVQRSFFDSLEFLIGFYLFSFWVHKKVFTNTIQSAVHMTIIGRLPETFNNSFVCWRNSGSHFLSRH